MHIFFCSQVYHNRKKIKEKIGKKYKYCLWTEFMFLKVWKLAKLMIYLNETFVVTDDFFITILVSNQLIFQR